MAKFNLNDFIQRPGVGLLIIRCGLGVMMFIHGMNKFSGGKETLQKVGGAIENLGVSIGHPAFALIFGAVAAGSQLIGGGILVLGWMARLGAFAIASTMAVATLEVMGREGTELSNWGHPLLFCLVALGLVFTGPGRISIQKD